MNRETAKIGENVLFIGPGSRGGMLSVLESYAQMFRPFKIIYSQKEGSRVKKTLIAARAYTKFIWLMAMDRHIKIVHVNIAANNSLWRKAVFMRLGKLAGKKIIAHIHAGAFRDFYNQHPQKVKKALSLSDAIIALSPEWEQFFKEIGCNNVHVIPNPVAEPRDVSQEDTAVATCPMKLLFLGKICQNKGIYDLLEAVKEVGLSVTLDIGGAGETQLLQQRIQQLNLTGQVTIHGWVSGPQKEALLTSTDVFVLPSYWEGVPISILEAMTYSKPILSTNVGGIPSIVKDNVNGILITPGNIPTMVHALQHLASDVTLRRTMGASGYEMSRPYWTSAVASDLVSLYRSLIS